MIVKSRQEKLKEALQAIYAISIDPNNRTKNGLKPDALAKIQKICKNILGVKLDA